MSRDSQHCDGSAEKLGSIFADDHASQSLTSTLEPRQPGPQAPNCSVWHYVGIRVGFELLAALQEAVAPIQLSMDLIQPILSEHQPK